MNSVFYRYFLAFLPDPLLRFELARLCDAAGQFGRRITAERLHLTLCVVAEFAHRDSFIARRVDAALANHLPSSCRIRLGTVSGGPKGAAIFGLGAQHEIQDFYRSLLWLLAPQRILPMHRKSGLHPHITLGYDPSTFQQFKFPWEWVPGELVLIESEVGRGVHNVLRRWPLDPPPQSFLPFDCGLPLQLPPQDSWPFGSRLPPLKRIA
jgi:2'-5' RNA ligase